MDDVASVVWTHVGTTRGARACARREVSVSNIIADVCVPRLPCWARLLLRAGRVLGCWWRSFSRPRADGAVARRVTHPYPALVRRRRVSGTLWQCIRGASAAARGTMGRAASRVPHGWAAGHPTATSWPAPLWAGDARAASGGHLEATGPPAEAHAPRGAVSVLSVPAFRFARVRPWSMRCERRRSAHPRPRLGGRGGRKLKGRPRATRQSLCLTATMPFLL